MGKSRIVPAARVGRTTCIMILTSVVFPAPFGPRSPKIPRAVPAWKSPATRARAPGKSSPHSEYQSRPTSDRESYSQQEPRPQGPRFPLPYARMPPARTRMLYAGSLLVAAIAGIALVLLFGKIPHRPPPSRHATHRRDNATLPSRRNHLSAPPMRPTPSFSPPISQIIQPPPLHPKRSISPTPPTC